jgi:broad-specificity NMP kinase
MVNELPGQKDNPMWMAIIPQPPKPRDMILITLVSLAPIVIALLMQKPSLRQAIQMRAFHTTKVASQNVADFFQVIATKSAQEYQKVQL